MRLSCKAITNYANINQFDYSNQWSIRAGDPNTLYFQLIDLDQAGLRYMAGVGGSNQPTSLLVTFPSIDDSAVISVSATQESDDKSIWKVVLGTNQTPGSGNVVFAVTEGSNVRKFSALNFITVEYVGEDGMC